MLKTMRKHAKYFYVLFFIVILTFIFWGVGPLDKPTEAIVAEIDGEKITIEEYWRAYDRTREIYREIYKGQFNEEMEKKLNLKETVLNGLIDERVLLISARNLGLAVTDKELQDAIVNDTRFMRDGIFRRDVYFKTLELNRLTPEMFENLLRQQFIILKMKRLISSAVDVNPLELKGLPTDEKRVADARQAILLNKAEAAVKSYIDGIKQRMHLKVNIELIS